MGTPSNFLKTTLAKHLTEVDTLTYPRIRHPYPPYDKSFETTVGETFLKIAQEHFNENHRYKIFDKKNSI